MKSCKSPTRKELASLGKAVDRLKRLRRAEAAKNRLVRCAMNAYKLALSEGIARKDIDPKMRPMWDASVEYAKATEKP